MRDYLNEVDAWREREEAEADAKAARRAARRAEVWSLIRVAVVSLLVYLAFRLGAMTGCLL